METSEPFPTSTSQKKPGGASQASNNTATSKSPVPKDNSDNLVEQSASSELSSKATILTNITSPKQLPDCEVSLQKLPLEMSPELLPKSHKLEKDTDRTSATGVATDNSSGDQMAKNSESMEQLKIEDTDASKSKQQKGSHRQLRKSGKSEVATSEEETSPSAATSAKGKSTGKHQPKNKSQSAEIARTRSQRTTRTKVKDSESMEIDGS